MTFDGIIKALKARRIGCRVTTPYDTADEFYQDFLFNEELMIYSSNTEANRRDL